MSSALNHCTLLCSEGEEPGVEVVWDSRGKAGHFVFVLRGGRTDSELLSTEKEVV